MARKKGTPQKAREYKSNPPGTAKDGSKCYTRVNKVGGKYITCTGTQGKSKAKSPAPAAPKPKPPKKQPNPKKAPEYKKKKSTIGGSPPKGTKVKVGTLNPGKVIKDAPKASAGEKADKEALKKIGITRDVKEDEVRFASQSGDMARAEKYISSKDEKVFIRRIQKLAGWTTDYAPLSAAQRKKLLSFRGRNDIFLRTDTGLGSNSKTRAIDVVQIDKRDSKGRVIMNNLPKIRFKFIGKV